MKSPIQVRREEGLLLDKMHGDFMQQTSLLRVLERLLV